MKKLIILNIILAFLLTGCGKKINVTYKDISNPNFIIQRVWNDECIPTQLWFYKNGKYQYMHTYVGEYRQEMDGVFYKYTKTDIGYIKYNFDKIVTGLSERQYIATESEYRYLDENVKYLINYKNREYIIHEGEENKYLNELLDSIGIDLDTCAKEDSN